VAALYAVRLISLKLFMINLNPQLYIAPRGLITVLLYFGIPVELAQDRFSSGILLYAILLTGLVMTIGMIFHEDEAEDVAELHFENLAALDEELVKRE
jgi:hypothetical protein